MKIVERCGIFFILFFAILNGNYAQGIISNGGRKYVSNEIIVKFKSVNGRLQKSKAAFLKEDSFIGVRDMKELYSNKNNAELNKIYIIKYTSPHDPLFLSKTIKKRKNIVWAEPHFVDDITFSPDDSAYTDSTQWYLYAIKAAEAWDITKGDPDIVIGIIDTGVYWHHPDLEGNIWTNTGEIPDNNIDDDNNGYIDDVHGWDFGSGDNDPTEDAPVHGTHVAGIAAAVTNNSTGIASIGFKTKIMPVKITSGSSGEFAFPFDAIRYAIDNGANILNFSWRGTSYSNAEQELMNYAISKGVVIIAAAGNDNSDAPTYPASYKGVLSVAGTQTGDTRYSASNYGETIDVAAPGVSIYSTWDKSDYRWMSGTSMSTPLTAGLAALVKSQFPNYSPLQIEEQIRANTDNIDGVNPGFEKLLGSGRINAFKAVSNSDSKSVRAVDVKFIDTGNGDGILAPGESADIEIKFRNYLSAVSGLTVKLTSTDNNITFTNNSFDAGSLGTLDSVSNLGNKYSFDISPSVPQNHKLKLLLIYTADGYSDYQWIVVTLNPTYATQSGNDIALTLNGSGSLGFNNYGDPPTGGEGLKFKNGDNLMFEGAFMYGISSSNLMDAAHIVYLTSKSNDFKNVVPFTISNGDVADEQGRAVFNDDNAASGKLGIETELNSFSFANVPNDEFITLRYTLRNKSDSNYNNFYAGLFVDLDISGGDYQGDIAAYDDVNNFGYAYDADGNPDSTYVGLALVSSKDYGFYAILNDGSDGRVNVEDSFTDFEKWKVISSGVDTTTAGPGDISLAISAGPFNLPAQGRKDIAFTIGAAYNLTDLQAVMIQSRTKYNDIPVGITHVDNIPSEFSLSQNYPNPFNPSTNINFTIPVTGRYILQVYNILGEKVATLLDKKLSIGKYSVKFNAASIEGGLASGVYLYRLIGFNTAISRKMILLK